MIKIPYGISGFKNLKKYVVVFVGFEEFYVEEVV